LPVVATSPAVEGMHLVDGLDALVADDADGFADAVLRLYDDEALWNRIAINGRANVARHFSIDAARAVVRELFLSAPR
jgi:glycosyltransferase involved in cell wall biosynthesis